MRIFNTFDAVYYTIGFIVPGFIIDFCLRLFVPQKEWEEKRGVLYYLCLSCLNYAVWSWLVYILVKTNFAAEHPLASGLLWAVIVFVSPIFIAWLLLLLYRKNVAKALAKRMKLNIAHPTPTAWDYKFSTIKNKTWVTVVLEDGQTISGFFWTNSFASSDFKERDVYLEKVYVIDEESGEWSPVPRSDGMYVSGKTIKCIEFYEDSEGAVL